MRVITIKRPLRRRSSKETSTIRRSFRELTRSYFANEQRLEFAIEALLFAVIVIISALPIFAAADALNQFFHNTGS
jgi:hypothetical protein